MRISVVTDIDPSFKIASLSLPTIDLPRKDDVVRFYTDTGSHVSRKVMHIRHNLDQDNRLEEIVVVVSDAEFWG